MLKRIIIGAALFISPILSYADITSIFTYPAGNDKEIQFNDDGFFGASSSFKYNKTTGVLDVSTVTASKINISSITFSDGTTQTSASSGSGSSDNLGNHTATQSLNLSGFGIVNISTLSALSGRSNIYLSTTVSVLGGLAITGNAVIPTINTTTGNNSVTVSTNLYITQDLYIGQSDDYFADFVLDSSSNGYVNFVYNHNGVGGYFKLESITASDSWIFDAFNNVVNQKATLNMLGSNGIRFYDTANDNYSQITASTTMSGNVNLILPPNTTSASVGNVLKITGVNGDQVNLDFGIDSGAGGGISNLVEDTTPQLGGIIDFNGKDITNSSQSVYVSSGINQSTYTYSDFLNKPAGPYRHRLSEFTTAKQTNNAVTGGVGISGVTYVPEVDLLYLVDNNAVNISIYQAAKVNGTEWGNITLSGFTDPECLEYLWTIYDSSKQPRSAVFAVGEEGLNQIILFKHDFSNTSQTVTKSNQPIITPSNMWVPDASAGMESLTYNPYTNEIYVAKQTSFEFRSFVLDGSFNPVAKEPFDAATVWASTAVPAINDMTFDPVTRTVIAIGDEMSVSNNNQDIFRFNPVTGEIIEYWNNYIDSVGLTTGNGWVQSEGIAISPNGENMWVSSETNELAWLVRNSGSGAFNSASGEVTQATANDILALRDNSDGVNVSLKLIQNISPTDISGDEVNCLQFERYDDNELESTQTTPHRGRICSETPTGATSVAQESGGQLVIGTTLGSATHGSNTHVNNMRLFNTGRVVVSSTNVDLGAELQVDGDTDQVQLMIQGNSTQTSDIVVIENSAGTDFVRVSSIGYVNIVGSSLTVGGIDVCLENGVNCQVVSGGASSLQVEESDVQISSPTASIDFLGSDFDLTQSPTGEANVSLSETVAISTLTASTGLGSVVISTNVDVRGDITGNLNLFISSNAKSGLYFDSSNIDPTLLLRDHNSTRGGMVRFDSSVSGATVDLSVDSTNFELDISTNVNISGNAKVTDEVYGVSWNGSNSVPTKNAVYDKIETLGGGGGSDNLGNHIATTTLNMNNFGISNITGMSFSSDIFGPLLYVATPTASGQFNLRVATAAYGSGGLESTISMEGGSSPYVAIYAGDGSAPIRANETSVEIRRPINLYEDEGINYLTIAASSTMTNNIGFVLPPSTANAIVGGALEVTAINGSTINLGFSGASAGPTGIPNKLYSWAAPSSIATKPNAVEFDGIATISQNDGTNVDIMSASFDDTNDECRGFQFIVPTEVDLAGTATFGVTWFSTAATTGNVQWYFTWKSLNESESWDSTTTDDDAASDATQGTVKQLTETVWTETLSNLGWTSSETVVGWFCRDGDGDKGSDSMVGDAEAITFYIEIPRE